MTCYKFQLKVFWPLFFGFLIVENQIVSLIIDIFFIHLTLSLISLKKMNFWLWSEIVITFKHNTKFIKKSRHFQKFIFIQKNYIYIYIYISCIRKTISIYYNNLQKTLFQNSFIWKSFFWGKKLVVFF